MTNFERIPIFGNPLALASDKQIALELDAARAEEELSMAQAKAEAEDEKYCLTGPKGHGVKIKLT